MEAHSYDENDVIDSAATELSTSPTPICRSDERVINSITNERNNERISDIMTATTTTNLITRIRENDLEMEGRERDTNDRRGGEIGRGDVETDAHAWEEHMRFQSLEQTISFDGANLLEDTIAATFHPTHANPNSFSTGRVGSAGAIGLNGGLISQQPVIRVERGSVQRTGSGRWGSGVPTVPGVPLSSAAAIAMISARHQLEQGQDNTEGDDGDGGEEEDGDVDGDDRDMSAGTNDAIAIEHRFRALRITRALQGDTDEGEEEGGSIGNHSNEEYRYDLIDHTGGSVSPFTLFDDLQMLGDGVMDSLDASLLASPDSSTINGVYGDDRRECTNDLTPQLVQRDGRMNRGALNNTGSTDDLHNRLEQDGDSANDSDDSASAAESKSLLGLGSFDGMLDGSDFSYEDRDSDDRDDLDNGQEAGSVYGENTDGNESVGEESDDGDGDGDDDMELQRAILRSIGESDYKINPNNSNISPQFSTNPLPHLKAIIIDLSYQCFEGVENLENIYREKEKKYYIGKNISKSSLPPTDLRIENFSTATRVVFLIWQKIQNLFSESMEIFFSKSERRGLLFEIVRSPCAVLHMLPGICAGLHRLSTRTDNGLEVSSYKLDGFYDIDNCNEKSNASRRANDRNDNETNDCSRYNYDDLSNDNNTFNNIFYCLKIDSSNNVSGNNGNNNNNHNNEDMIMNNDIETNAVNDIASYSSNFKIEINSPFPIKENNENRRFSCTEKSKDEHEQTKNVTESNSSKMKENIFTDFLKISDMIDFIKFIQNNHLADKVLISNLCHNDHNLEFSGSKDYYHFTPSGVPLEIHSENVDSNNEFSEILYRKSRTATSLFLILRSILAPLLIFDNQYFEVRDKINKKVSVVIKKNEKLKEEENNEKIKLEEKKKDDDESVNGEKDHTNDNLQNILNLLIICIERDLNGIFESRIFQVKKNIKSKINSMKRKKEKVLQAEKLKNVLNSTFSGILLPFLAIIYSHNREIISVQKFLPFAVRLLELFYRLNKNSQKTDGEGQGGEGEGGGGGGGGGKSEGNDIKEEKKEVMKEDETDCSGHSEDETPVWSHVVLIAWLEDKFKWVG